MRSTWYATYVCNVKSISMTVDKSEVCNLCISESSRERQDGVEGRAGQTCSTMLNWARGSLRSALLHHKCAFYNPYQFLPFPQFLQGFTHVLSRKCRKWHLRALVGSFSLKSRMVGRLDNSGAGLTAWFLVRAGFLPPFSNFLHFDRPPLYFCWWWSSSWHCIASQNLISNQFHY